MLMIQDPQLESCLSEQSFDTEYGLPEYTETPEHHAKSANIAVFYFAKWDSLDRLEEEAQEANPTSPTFELR